MTCQKSRTLWISEGDQNTRFFHYCLKNRLNQNKIISISLEDGTRIFHLIGNQRAAVSYFQNLFNTSSAIGASTDLRSFVHKTIQRDQAITLEYPISPTEIQERMKADKAPGLDGFNACFFQKMWHVVGEDVIAAVRSFFESGSLLKEMNHISITLVPKVPNPSTWKDFRPISCCNLVYKCISGILARRL